MYRRRVKQIAPLDEQLQRLRNNCRDGRAALPPGGAREQ